MIIVESASMTDRGRKRRINEDALIAENGLGLYAVADGMGGHQAGEIASRLVVDTMNVCMRKFSADQSWGVAADVMDDTLSPEANQVLAAIRISNRLVYQTAQENQSCRGMGSTVSAAFFTDSTLIAANVGDSPIYLIRDHKIKLLSVPHTLLAEQAIWNPGNIEKLQSRFRHVLTRAVGTEKNVNADIYEIQCFRDDILVISSDGLSDKASQEEILELVDTHAPPAACRQLVKLAIDRGGDDNVSVIVLKVATVKNCRRKIQRFMALMKRNSVGILSRLKR